LDSRLPSRLCGAFPPGVEIERIGLADAVRIVREFLPREG
jgi:ATP-dependent DNA helicase DinG